MRIHAKTVQRGTLAVMAIVTDIRSGKLHTISRKKNSESIKFKNTHFRIIKSVSGHKRKNGRGCRKRVQSGDTVTKNQRIRCARIAEHYGLNTQEIQTVSELSELLHVLTRKMSQRGIDWDNCLLDELADVTIMIQQMCALHGISEYELNDRVNFKIERQLERIENGE